ncbi:hypothetical protein A2524_02085 [Candidatus Wolfebacteria bacterium RIFOXYD12_FULL_48_21]|nr:MAG: hypothetical protein A2524_02085 [Candidatus Wolfebacteria bacterium RIFOXYD12_FULL_48_21]OGM95688.1 MAG: hypothetical protein A2532_02900 [Candidatus Wolfebacteria bacterium RIFOXYD2_FULL_48_11]
MGYTEKDAAKDTGSSGKETARAWHSARDDAAASGELESRNERKVSDSENGSILYSIFKAVFGKD